MKENRIVYKCEQRSDEWHELRLGKITGTGFEKVLAKGQGKTRNDYMIKLIAERMTGLAEDGFKNEYMEWGTENEPLLIEAYQNEHLCVIEPVGFVELNSWVGCSPDGFVGEDGMIEGKCPKSTTHLQYILSGKVPGGYMKQIQGNLWVTGRKWCDFVSFDPRVEQKPLHIIRVDRDDKIIDNINEECQRFITDLQGKMATITGINF